jgi:uncharacterized cupredoxin-like copper-binding protein
MMNYRLVYKVLAIAMIAALAACAGGSSKPTQPVDVEVKANEFSFQSSLTTFSVGVPYHFVVTNTGTVAHEFMIMKPMEPGAMSMEEMDKMALGVIEEDDLQPGATASVDVTFKEPAPPGTLEFACHTAGHYEAGMHLPITVQ